MAELAADSGYASETSYATLETLKTTALIAPQPKAKHDAAARARERMRTSTGRDAAVDRQAHAEGAISELKRHGADRARCRGTRLVQLQLLAAATAINLKRLLSHGNAAHNDQAGQPGTPHAAQTSQIAAPNSQISDPDARNAEIRLLTRTLIDILTEIDRLTTADRSTGS